MQLENTKLTEEQIVGLKKLREPFPPEQISKLPKPTAVQTAEVKKNFKAGIRCNVCGGWHHPKVVHLDYVGHAALTSRLLDADLLWDWEPFATEEDGSPKLDQHGGMWIWLTVCGMKRRGYGDSDGKSGSNANKERIGDALRNAAMRFGAALDLWSKADLTNIQEDEPEKTEEPGQHEDMEQEPSRFKKAQKFIDDHIERKALPESLQAGWDQYFVPAMAEFTLAEQEDLKKDFKATMQELKEIQGDKQ